MSSPIKILLLTAAFYLLVSCDLGADFRIHHCHSNSTIGSINFACLKNEVSFISFEAWGPHHAVAGNLKSCLEASTKAFDVVDLHIRLCPNCPGAEHKGGFKIMTDLYKVVKDHKDAIDTVWFQVVCHKKFLQAPVPNCGWDEPTFVGAKANLAHIVRLMAYAKVLGFDVGIFTSDKAWNFITSNSTVLSDTLGTRLWYKATDGNPDFNDAHHNFGGWDSTNEDKLRKQYKTNQKICHVDHMNLDFQGASDYEFLKDFDMRGAVDTLSPQAFEKTALLAIEMEFERRLSDNAQHWSSSSIAQAEADATTLGYSIDD